MGQSVPIGTVLVVEDDPFVLDDAVDIVETLGYVALEARNADAAMRLLESRPDISVLFTDIDMPGSIDGLALARAVRDRWPAVKVIIASGVVTPAARELPQDAVFFPKPYGRGAVSAALRRVA